MISDSVRPSIRVKSINKIGLKHIKVGVNKTVKEPVKRSYQVRMKNKNYQKKFSIKSHNISYG